MKLTKDECRVLSELTRLGKYEITDKASTKQQALDEIRCLEDLEERLDKAGRDERRQGRTSQNDFSDCMKRLVAKHSKR